MRATYITNLTIIIFGPDYRLALLSLQHNNNQQINIIATTQSPIYHQTNYFVKDPFRMVHFKLFAMLLRAVLCVVLRCVVLAGKQAGRQAGRQAATATASRAVLGTSAKTHTHFHYQILL